MTMYCVNIRNIFSYRISIHILHSMSTCHFVQQLVPTPVGVLTLISDTQGIVRILWPNSSEKSNFLACSGQNLHLSQTIIALEKYFSRQSFSLPVFHTSGTDFQKSVWKALQEIPYGTTQTYAEIASKIGKPRAIRAVATAIGKNPFCILIPCHRVIGTNGELRGFAGGLPAKQWLLDFEKAR